MQKNGEWTNWFRVAIIFAECLILYISYLLSLLLLFQSRYIPADNGIAFQTLIPWILLMFIFINVLSGVYVLYNKSREDLLFLTIMDQVLLSIVTMVLSFLSPEAAFPRLSILIHFVISVIGLYALRLVVFSAYHHYSPTRRIMIIGYEEDVFKAIYNFRNSKASRHVVTHVVLTNYYDNIEQRLNEFDVVYLASRIPEDVRLRIYDLLMRKHKKLFLNSQFENLMMVRPNIMNFEDESIIETSDFRIPSDQKWLKRLMDIIFSLVMLVLTSPIFLLTALAIKLTSPGPVFYKQVRITEKGKEFKIYKFRSMTADAEKATGPIIARKNDSRVTPVGHFIRAVRIDELPQLLNILKGEMAVVGPRPERPVFVQQFQKENPSYYLRHNVKAGLTGYAQVYGKYASDFNSKLNFDLIYIKTYSIMLDLRIMLQTVRILFEKVSSSGIDEEELPTQTREEIQGMGIELIE